MNLMSFWKEMFLGATEKIIAGKFNDDVVQYNYSIILLQVKDAYEYSNKVRANQIDKTLSSYCSESEENMGIDEWWAKLLKLNKFPF